MQRPKPMEYTRISKRVITIEAPAVSLSDVHPAPPGACFAGAPPPRASPPLTSTVLLSPLDTCVFVKNLSPTCAFWYAVCPDPALLVESLRRTLRVFPIVAGRLLLFGPNDLRDVLVAAETIVVSAGTASAIDLRISGAVI